MDGQDDDARAAWAAGDWTGATTALLERYGAEVHAYLVVLARSEADGADAYSRFAEKLWRALPRFRWESSARTWCYLLARHALAELRRAAPARRARRHVPLSARDAIAAQVRSTTAIHRRTATKAALAAARATLTPEEQELLYLRVDRQLAWREIARIIAGDDLDEARLTRASALLRKRFEKLKDRLRILLRPRG